MGERRPFSQAERFEVWEAFGGVCYYCNDPLNPRDWHVDHVTPISREGGTNDLDNLAAACSTCNLEKGDLTETEYRRKKVRDTAKMGEAEKWFAAHDVPFIKEDWGAGGVQVQKPERIGRAKVIPWDPAWFDIDGEQPEDGEHRFRSFTLLWEQRDDLEELAALEEFFAPYLAFMPAKRRKVLDEYLMDRRTQQDIADELGVSPQAVSKQLSSAYRWVEQAIEDETGQDAWVVFNDFWSERFGSW